MACGAQLDDLEELEDDVAITQFRGDFASARLWGFLHP